MRGILLMTLALCACVDAPAPVFTARPVALAVPAQQLAVDDLDGDGRLDLVSVGGMSAAIRPWSDARFERARAYALPGSAHGLVLADLDGDGRLDLATALPQRAALAWLPGVAGGLAPARELHVDAALRTLVAADVDGDGVPDLIAAAEDSDELLLLRGGPDGPRLSQRLRLGAVLALATADLDGDGRSEVLAALPGRGAVQLLTVTPDGLLAPGPLVWQSSFPVALAAADLDGDGVPDLAAVDALTRRVFVALGDGAGGWRSRSQWAVDLEPAALLVRRGPGGPELVLTGADRRSVALVEPRTGRTRLRASTRDRHLGFAVADLDGDGVDELLHGDAVLRDVAGYTLRAHGPPLGPATHSLLRVDLDGDGRDELVVETVAPAELIVYATEGAALRERHRAPAPKQLHGLRALARGDGGHDLAWWGATGHGLLAGADLGPRSSVEHDAIVALIPLHLDEDGRHDLAILSRTSSTTRALTLAIRAGDRMIPTGPVHKLGKTTSIVAARLDGDARDDLWIAHDTGVTVLRSRDAWAPVPIAALGDLASAQAVDLDGDGMLDLVGCDPTGPRGVLAAHGQGDGALGPTVRLAQALCTRIHPCDLDQDGRAELVLERVPRDQAARHPSLEVLRATPEGWTSAGSLYPGLAAEQLALACAPEGLSVWTGGGRGLALLDLVTGPALVEQAPPRAPSRVLLGDLDGDGLDDLLADDLPRVMLARADGAGAFAPTVSLARPAIPAQIVGIGEFDGEAGAELLVAETDLNGRRSHALWALRDDQLIRTHALAAATWEVLADFDGDGRDELLTLDHGWPALVRPDAEPQPLDRRPFAGMHALRAADMDGDGRSDLLASPPPASPFSAAPILLLRSEGPGFAAARALGLTGPLAVGDLDHDGALDLVRVEPGVGLTLCRAGVAGPASRCEAMPWLAAPQPASALAIADLDGDGEPDLVLGLGSHLQLLRGDGAGGLVPTPPQPLVSGQLRPARLGGAGPGWVLLAPDAAHLLTVEPGS